MSGTMKVAKRRPKWRASDVDPADMRRLTLLDMEVGDGWRVRNGAYRAAGAIQCALTSDERVPAERKCDSGIKPLKLKLIDRCVRGERA